MELTRRRTLQLLGSTTSLTVAGCISGSGDGGDTDGNSPDRAEDPPTTDLPQVDEPPYEIEEPSCEGGGRDPLWLCENRVAEPSVTFEQEATTGTVLTDEGLQLDTEGQLSQFYVALLTGEDDFDRIDDGIGPANKLIRATDFETEAAIVVQTGWGSGTITPHLKRIEEAEDGVHAVGCYRRPCGGTDDITVRTVAARFDRPDTLETARVSLTADPETRVTFEDGEVASVEADLD